MRIINYQVCSHAVKPLSDFLSLPFPNFIIVLQGICLAPSISPHLQFVIHQILIVFSHHFNHHTHTHTHTHTLTLSLIYSKNLEASHCFWLLRDYRISDGYIYKQLIYTDTYIYLYIYI